LSKPSFRASHNISTYVLRAIRLPPGLVGSAVLVGAERAAFQALFK